MIKNIIKTFLFMGLLTSITIISMGNVGYREIMLKERLSQVMDVSVIRKTQPILIAAEYGYIDVIRFLIEEKGVSVDVRDDCFCGDMKMIKKFFNHEKLSYETLELIGYQNIGNTLLDSMRDTKGLTALHVAAKYGQLEIVRYIIIERNISPNDKDKNGETPLDYAIASNHIDVANYIAEKIKEIEFQEALRRKEVEIQKKISQINSYKKLKIFLNKNNLSKISAQNKKCLIAALINTPKVVPVFVSNHWRLYGNKAIQRIIKNKLFSVDKKDPIVNLLYMAFHKSKEVIQVGLELKKICPNAPEEQKKKFDSVIEKHKKFIYVFRHVGNTLKDLRTEWKIPSDCTGKILSFYL